MLIEKKSAVLESHESNNLVFDPQLLPHGGEDNGNGQDRLAAKKSASADCSSDIDRGCSGFFVSPAVLDRYLH